jgi:large subunit ribosomal protein L32
MAVPKGKVSKARRDKRRSSHWKLDEPALSVCPKCGAFRLPHRICKSCWTYKGREYGKAEASAK